MSERNKKSRYPITYDLYPKSVQRGKRYLTLDLENIGEEDLYQLDIRLNTLDSRSLSVSKSGKYISALGAKEKRVRIFEAGERISLSFEAEANSSGRAYVSIDGKVKRREFSWESPGVKIKVDDLGAEIVSLFVLGNPYPPVGKVVRFEAAILGFKGDGHLNLDFWIETPTSLKHIKTIETLRISVGRPSYYSAKHLPAEVGLHTVHCYLYHRDKRIDYRSVDFYAENGVEHDSRKSRERNLWREHPTDLDDDNSALDVSGRVGLIPDDNSDPMKEKDLAKDSE